MNSLEKNIHLVKEYLQDEKNEAEGKIINIKHMFEKCDAEIEEVENQIEKIQENIDFAYEAFSPISNKGNFVKTETEQLENLLKIKKEKKKELQELLDRCENKNTKLKNCLEALSYFEDTGAKEKEEFRQIYGFKILEQRELERQRIARDLHDTTVQNLAALIHEIEFCSKIMDSDPIRTKLELEIMSNTLRDAINNMREVIYNLRPMTYDDLGFTDTLMRAIERMKKGTDIKIQFKINGSPYEMASIIQLSILRIIQEAINNSKKYSEADNLYITLTYEKQNICLEIKDDGVGFELENVKEKVKNSKDNCGFGISMMKERIYLLSGEISIQSAKGEGTLIYVIIPRGKLEEDKNENQNSNCG